jgi:hypothetical protein
VADSTAPVLLAAAESRLVGKVAVPNANDATRTKWQSNSDRAAAQPHVDDERVELPAKGKPAARNVWANRD